MVLHWASEYIGMPYESGGRGPKKVDCWGLVWVIYRNQYGIELPLFPGVTDKTIFQRTSIIENAAQDWVEVSEPFEGCLVAMSQRSCYHHVGLFVAADRGKILHGWSAAGRVVADTLQGLQYRSIQTVRFYQHKLWPTLSK